MNISIEMKLAANERKSVTTFAHDIFDQKHRNQKQQMKRMNFEKMY